MAGSPRCSAPLLPQQLAALTVLVVANVSSGRVKAPLPQLPQLRSLRRMDLRFTLCGCGPEGGGCAVLPALPTSLTYLSIGVRPDHWKPGSEESHFVAQV